MAATWTHSTWVWCLPVHQALVVITTFLSERTRPLYRPYVHESRTQETKSTLRSFSNRFARVRPETRAVRASSLCQLKGLLVFECHFRYQIEFSEFRRQFHLRCRVILQFYRSKATFNTYIKRLSAKVITYYSRFFYFYDLSCVINWQIFWNCNFWTVSVSYNTTQRKSVGEAWKNGEERRVRCKSHEKQLGWFRGLCDFLLQAEVCFKRGRDLIYSADCKIGRYFSLGYGAIKFLFFSVCALATDWPSLKPIWLYRRTLSIMLAIGFNEMILASLFAQPISVKIYLGNGTICLWGATG